MTTRLQARFDGKALIPLEPVDLPENEILEIEVRESADPRPGSPAAILKAMREPPIPSAEDIAEMERMIEEGKLPINYRGCFDEEGEE